MKKTRILLLPFLIFGMSLAGCKKSSSKEVAVTSITLNQTSLEVEVGETKNLVATVLPENATDKTVTWSTGNAQIATVVGGAVKGVAVGNTKITAMAGKYSAVCDVAVKEKSVTRFTVTFDSDGGSAVSAQTVNAGEKATKPADPTKDGFTFQGWYLGENAFDFNSAITGNITLKAHWQAASVERFTVTFDSDGGSAVASQTIDKGATATKPTDPTKDGFTFKGWFNGETEFVFTTPITADITLKAHWQQDAPAVVYSVKFGSGDAITLQADPSFTPQDNHLGYFKATIPSVTAGDAIAFSKDGVAITENLGPNGDNASENKYNNYVGSLADGFKVQNTAENVVLHLDYYGPTEQDNHEWLGFFLEGGNSADHTEGGGDPGTTVPDYVIHLGSGEEWTDKAMSPDSEENPTEYSALNIALKVGDVFKIHMKDASATELDWRGYSDLKLSEEAQANFKEGATDDNIEVKVAGTYDFYVKVTPEPQTDTYAGKSIWIAKQAEVIAVTGVTVAPTSLTLEAGKHSTLTATVAPENASDKAVTWSVAEGGDYASVDQNGQVTAITEGTAVIKATSHADETKFGQCTVTVTPAKTVESISATYNGGTIYVGEKLNGEELELTKTYNDSTEAAFDDEDLADLEIYADSELTQKVDDYLNYVFLSSDTALTKIYVKLGDLSTSFDVTIAEPTYKYIINDSDPVALTDDSEADKQGDTWTEQWKAVLSLAADDVVTFVYGRTVLDVGAGEFDGNNVEYVSEGKTLKVRQAGNDLELFLKVYDNGEQGLGYSAWLTGYVAPHWVAKVNGTEVEVHDDPKNEGQYMLLHKGLAVNDLVIFEKEESKIGYSAIDSDNVDDGVEAMFTSGTNGELKVVEAGSFNFYFNPTQGKLWITKEVEIEALSLVGSFNEWNEADTTYDMTILDGVATFSNFVATAGAKFKICANHAWTTSFGSDLNVVLGEGLEGAIVTDGGDLKFAKGGTFNFSFTLETNTLNVTGEVTAVNYYLCGTFNSWAAKAEDCKMTKVSDNEYTIEIELEAEDKIKVVSSGDVWYGNASTWTDCGFTLDGDGNVIVTEAGTYTVHFYVDGTNNNHIVIVLVP